MGLIQSWRWYGPNDIVSLDNIEQAGATCIVTALHQVPVGEVWTVDQINERKRLIEWNDATGKPRNLTWGVVESVNIHESIKMGLPEREDLIRKYCITLRNLAQCGIFTVCYNFMPVLDWSRTDLKYKVKDGSHALRFDAISLAAFDLYILGRKGALTEYSDEVKTKAKAYLESLGDAEKEDLQKNILAGVPGTLQVLAIDDFRDYLKKYEHVDEPALKSNLKYFLEKVVPVAEEVGVKLCIHPDDPPYPIFGLPRVVSTLEDLEFICNSVDSPSNGVTFCTGSLGPRPENDLPAMVRKLGGKIHFLHLRNIQREADGSFYEADHLDGSVDMYEVMLAVVEEMNRRKKEGKEDFQIPVRPDHGHTMLDDLSKHIPFHGYSAIGRLRGLSELRGLELGIARTIYNKQGQ